MLGLAMFALSVMSHLGPVATIVLGAAGVYVSVLLTSTYFTTLACCVLVGCALVSSLTALSFPVMWIMAAYGSMKEKMLTCVGIALCTFAIVLAGLACFVFEHRAAVADMVIKQ